MAATVIDSFVVELGLDPTKFNANQKKAVDGFKKSQDELESRAQNVDKTVSNVGTSLGGMARQATVFLGALGAGKFMVNFATETITAAAGVGRLTRSISENATTVSKWQGVARVFGGDAASMANSFTTLSDAFAGWKVGIVSPMIADFRAISTAGGKIIDINKGVEQSLFDLADNLKNIADRGPDGRAQAGLLGRRLGLDPASIDLLMQGSARVREELAKISGLTQKNVDDATALERRWNGMMVAGQQMGMRFVFGTIDAGKSFFNKMRTGNTSGVETETDGYRTSAYDGRRYKVGSDASGATPSAPAAAGGAFTSQEEKAAFIREVARKNGIDPEVALRVSKTEGFNNFVSTVPGEKSYGAFQLNRSKTSKPSLGDMFAKDTGLDPSDPKTEKQGIEYALKYAATSGRGWADWYGARNNGIGQFAGIPQGGASGGAGTTVQQLNVYTQPGADGRQIGGDIREELTRNQSRAANANSGPQ